MTLTQTAHDSTHEGARESRPRFSVVIPAFNAQATIEMTVRSVLGQTFGDFEVIVVDDGSSDGTADVVRRLALEDSRVRLIAKPNGGCASARNVGCRDAMADYVGLLDADDQYLPQYLEVMDDLIRRHPDADLLSCNGIRRKGDREARIFTGRAFSTERSFSLREMIEADRVFVMAVFRKSLHQRVGGFREELPYGEDYDFWLRCFAAGAVHVYTPQVLGLHVRSATSKSSNLVAHATGIKRILEDLRNREALDGAELETLQRALHALDMRIERVELEQRMQRGDFSHARATYLRTRPAYISEAKFFAGLVVILLSPRLYRAVMARR